MFGKEIEHYQELQKLKAADQENLKVHACGLEAKLEHHSAALKHACARLFARSSQLQRNQVGRKQGHSGRFNLKAWELVLEMVAGGWESKAEGVGNHREFGTKASRM